MREEPGREWKEGILACVPSLPCLALENAHP
jgi:hypothetical protein